MFQPDSLASTWDSIVITVVVLLVVAGIPLVWRVLRDHSPDRDRTEREPPPPRSA